MAPHATNGDHPVSDVHAITRDLLRESGPVSQHWGVSPAIVHGVGLAHSIPSVDEILATPMLRAPYVTLFRDQAPLPPEVYSKQERIVASMDPENIADLGRIEDQIASGAGVKFNRMELWCPPVRRVAEALSAAADRPIQVWGFYTPEQAQTLPWHRDTAHNLELQVSGRKRWFLGGPFTVATETPPERLSDVVRTVHTQPDDVLYLPYAYGHCATAEGGRSFHISLALQALSAGQVHRRVLDHVASRLDPDSPAEAGELGWRRVVLDAAGVLCSVAERLELVAAQSGSDRGQPEVMELAEFLSAFKEG
jgi:hypothetical protein